MDSKQFFEYQSELCDLSDINSSFAKGILKVAYVGKNRNNSCISKKAFENAIPTIFNVPIVANYSREENEIGSHDSELVEDEEGNLKFVNITHPVGVVPESAKYWWDEVEDNGVMHEYLFIEVYLWKRQECYQKIVENGITDESMEITILKGNWSDDGYYNIEDFIFTAFCLLGTAEPCYESASLSVFSKDNMKAEFTEMMNEFKTAFSKNNLEVKNAMDEKMALLEKYEISVEDLDFSLEEFSLEEIEEKLSAMKEEPKSEDFSLNVFEQIDEIQIALENEKFIDDWGYESCKYWLIDIQDEMLIVADTSDHWRFYGIPYSFNGDEIVIHFEDAKRVKTHYEFFDEGETNTQEIFSMENYINKHSEFVKANAETSKDAEFEEIKSELEKVKEDYSLCQEAKAELESKEKQAKISKIFDKFDSLIGENSEYSLIKENCELEPEELETKCYVLLGKENEKFSKKDDSVKILVEEKEIKEEAYGGLLSHFCFK